MNPNDNTLNLECGVQGVSQNQPTVDSNENTISVECGVLGVSQNISLLNMNSNGNTLNLDVQGVHQVQPPAHMFYWMWIIHIYNYYSCSDRLQV